MADDIKKYVTSENLSYYDSKVKARMEAADTAVKNAVDAEIGTIPAKVGETETKTVVAYVDAKTADAKASVTALDNSLKAIAKSGKAADVTVEDTAGLYTATTVEAVLAEIAGTDGTIATAVKALADGQVKTNKEAIDAINNETTGILKTAENYTDTEIGKVNTKIGTVTEGKTVVEMISDAQDAAEDYADGLVGTLTDLETTAKGTVVAAINEVNTAVSTAQAAGKVSIDTTTTTTGMLKSYTFYQGEKTDANKLGTIDIPKDYLVKSAELKTVTTADTPYTGAKVGDKYIDFVINTKDASATDEHLYIPVNDLFDSYTSGSADTDKVVITVDNDTNKISASVTAGAIGTTELADKAVTNAKIADATIARAKIDAAFEAQIAALETASGEGVDTKIKNAVEALDATVTNAVEEGDQPDVVVSVVETDGKLTSVSATVTAGRFDASGAAKAVQGETTETVASVNAKVTAFTAMTTDEIDAIFTPATT